MLHIDDVVRGNPPECRFTIDGHFRGYSFTDLVPLYGLKACEQLGAVWIATYKNVNASTAYNEFRLYRRLLRDLASADCSESKAVFEAISSCQRVPAREFTAYIARLRERILSPNDTTFTNAGHDSVVKFLETLRNCLKRLAEARKLPPVEISTQGMYGGAYEMKTPCFATIALNAQRFSLDGDNDHENALRFHVMNKNMLQALRSALVQVFNEAYDCFVEGCRLLNNPEVPRIPAIIRAIRARAALWGKNARADRGDAAYLDGAPEYVRAVALTAYKALYHEKSIPVSRLSLARLLKQAGGTDYISRLAEPASEALMAAVTIVQIDTGWEASTVLNMDLDPFVGTVKKNSIIVRAVVSRKKRAQGKLRNAALIDIDNSDEEPDKDVAIILKQKGVRTAYQIIIAYKEMTEHIRNSLRGRSKNKLWICRSSRTVNENVYDAFVRFLARNDQNPLFGGLPLTRRSIKRTKFNVDAGATQGNLPLAQARGDHSDLRTSIAYLSAPAVRALFQHKLREYLNQLDVIIYDGVDDLAVKLGISEYDLHRRRALGIENGLTELLSGTTCPPSAPEELSDELKNLNPSDAALRSLCLAGEALEARWEEMAAKNPARFLRAWVPWMAVVQALATKILNGRHRVKFKTMLKRVRSELALGQTFMPAIW